MTLDAVFGRSSLPFATHSPSSLVFNFDTRIGVGRLMPEDRGTSTRKDTTVVPKHLGFISPSARTWERGEFPACILERVF